MMPPLREPAVTPEIRRKGEGFKMDYVTGRAEAAAWSR
jgi:hypothetical protein